MSSYTEAASHLTTPEFIAVLKRSGLLTEPQLVGVLHRVDEVAAEADPTRLAEQLVRDGVLTEFQVWHLLVGNDQGLKIGRYRILDRIGGGSMGWVFKARHDLMERVVAIKVISPKYASGPDSLPRFLLEMKIVALLDHPNVVRAFDADLIDGKPYMVMEYVTGENLDQIAKRSGPLPAEEVVNYLAQAARGMAHAHEKGVIHRDIKPSNLALDASGVVKILDLGLGVFVDVDREESYLREVDQGFAVGTADYMSPEQVSGQVLDGRTDLFSLGCTMHYLIAGSHAFAGTHRVDRLVSRLNDRPIPLRDVCPGVPYAVVAVLDRLLAREPADRYATAAEAAEALEGLIPVARRNPGASRVASGGKPPATKAAASPQSDPKSLDWALIETELRAEEEPSKPAESLQKPTPQPAKLASHRRSLEAEGEDSGREVLRQYRAELIQLKREIIEKQTHDRDDAPARSRMVRRFESFGENVGNFLSEPSAGQIVLVLFLTVVAVLVALSVALS